MSEPPRPRGGLVGIPTMPDRAEEEVQRNLDVARRFASALDRDDFALAQALLSDDCVYHIREQTHTGAAAIIETYRAASEWAACAFDAIKYDSSIEALDDGRIAITFLDRLRHKGLAHKHRCRQIVTIDQAVRITRIEHEDLPGEPEAVQSFLDRVGITREG